MKKTILIWYEMNRQMDNFRYSYPKLYCLTVLLVFLLIILLFLPFTKAEIDLDPTSFDIEVYEQENNSFSINIENYYLFDIYNLTFSNVDGIRFQKIEFIEKANVVEELNESNHTINVTYPTQSNCPFWIMTNGSFQESYLSIMSFLYRDYRDAEHQTINIEVSNSGFSPNYVEAHQNDTIIFINTGEENHTVTSLDGNFDYNLTASQSIQTNFSGIGIINYYDRKTFLAGKINVTNKSILTYLHSSDYDKQLPVTIKSKHQRAEISFSIFLTTVELSYNEKTANVLNIVNNGNITAYNISFSGDWMSFEENNFDLEGYEDKILYFNITPENITEQSDTDRYYYMNISMQGNNFDTQNQTVNVFIKYANFTAPTYITQNLTQIVIVTKEDIEMLCRERPEVCPTINVTVEKIVERDKDITVKGSDLQDVVDIVETWKKKDQTREADYQEELSGIRGEMQDTRTQVNAEVGDIKGELSETKNKMENISKDIEAINHKLEGQDESQANIVTGAITMIVIIGLGLLAYNYRSSKKIKSTTEDRW